jgi:hypothetical protein
MDYHIADIFKNVISKKIMINLDQLYKSNEKILFVESIPIEDGTDIKFRVHDISLTRFIRKTYFDDIKSEILTSFNEPFCVDQAIQKINSPPSSIYKKHKELVDTGFLIHTGYVQNVKSTMLYTNIFSEISTIANNNIQKIDVIINQKVLSKFIINDNREER